MTATTNSPTLQIIGSGFAALTAAKNLRKHQPQARIQLISPRDELVYYPSLIWLPAGLRKPADLVVKLSRFLARHNIEWVEASVTGVSAKGRSIQTSAGELHNDGLIIASGGRFIKKLPGIEHAFTPCEGIDPVMALSDKLAQLDGGTIAIGFGGNPNEPSAMRGGPMFEFLFGIDTLLRRQGRRDKFKLVFFNPAAEPGKRLGEKVPQKMLAMMAERGIDTKLGQKIMGFGSKQVQLANESFSADLILFMPGMTGPAWLASSDLPLSPGGMIQADEFTQVVDCPGTYVAGDSGSFPGPEWQPKQAHAADIQAKTAATNLSLYLKQQPAQAKIKHELICIVDTLDKGMLIKRTDKGTLMLPPLRIMHYAKRIFEGLYLRQYR
ncbi:FAD-dependent pyridine nucleotide-disulfide oxidoreductase [Thiomicrospira aerophila AL3]|uniref:FAD-dependent pyridine nucleotide-disulfide oxidoreductase n=1 Tax=Thiomicrospira aerophila AL3 TaxID=717772 RepID=W0DVM3_9GAMM|nr:FAD-dependent oxidoreductase [Thiomicrospira aerophila]AHF00921.1 FAD-dependent pyridine nucleotide-disulfide oxidoreductase [Thiomicrospira aerophila AL3]